MNEALEAIFDGRRVGRTTYARDRIRFEYKLWKIGRPQWEKTAGEWKLDPSHVLDSIIRMAGAMPAAVREVGDTMAGPGEVQGALVHTLMERILERVEQCLRAIEPVPQ